MPTEVLAELTAGGFVNLLAKAKKALVDKKDPEYLLRKIEDEEYRLIPEEIRDALKGLITERRSDQAALIGMLDSLIRLAEARLPPRLADLLDPLEAEWDKTDFEPPPSSLLLAKYGIVPFRGREVELKDLHDWCDGPGRVRLRLYTGAGGMGKTRLFIKFAHELREGGAWKAGFLRDDKALERCRFDSEISLLVVMDYAERRSPAVVTLLRGFLGAKDAPKVRVVLLARSEQEWWDGLRRSDGDLAEFLQSAHTEGPIPVGAPSDDANGRLTAFRNATEAFRTKLNRPHVTAAPPDLTKKDFDRILVIHMAALAAVDGRMFDDETRLMDHLAEREERFLIGRLAAKQMNETLAEPLFQAAVLATLAGGADSREKACVLVGRTPLMEGQDKAVVSVLTDILLGTYPGADADGTPRLNGIEPDLFGEHFLYRWMKKNCDRRLLELAVDPGMGEGATEHTLTVLTRLARRRPEAENWLRRVLAHDAARLIPLAVDVTQETGDPVGRIAAEVLKTKSDTTIAFAIADKIPLETTALRELAEASTRLCLEAHQNGPDADPEEANREIARYLNNLGIWLSALGRREEALEATREAADLYRLLVAARPDTFRPDLASSLNNLGVRLSDLGRREEALEATREGVAIRRDLAAARPDAFRPDLAMSLNNLGLMLSALGRREEAMEATRKAADLYRDLAAARPDAFRSYLASSLNNLGKMLSDLGRREEALEATREVVAICRDLAAARPDAFRPDLASSLNNLGLRLSALGRREEALEATREAVAIRRDLAVVWPDTFQPDLAMSLSNLGIWLSALGRREEALEATREAVAIRRDFAVARPDAIRPDLAQSLYNLGQCLAQSEDDEAACKAFQEGLETLAPYFLRLPAAFADLAEALTLKYTAACERLGVQPDIEFLEPFFRVLADLEKDGDPEE